MAIIQSPWLGKSRKKLGGAVTYSADGKVIARSMPASVRNPRTSAQVLTRVILSTVSKAYSRLQGIVDHSFEGYKVGGKNQQRFNKVNADIMRTLYRAAASESHDLGNFNAKGFMGALINQYQVSEGTLPPQVYTLLMGAQGRGAAVMPLMQLDDTISSETTYRQVCEMLGLPLGAQLTFMFVVGKKNTAEITRMKVGRVVLEPSDGNFDGGFLSDGAILHPNAKNEMDGIEITADAGGAQIGYLDINGNVEWLLGVAVIASVYEGDKWRRSTQSIVYQDGVVDKNLISEAIASWQTSADVSSPLYLNQGIAEGE